VHLVVTADVAGELCQPERALRVRDDVCGRVVRQARRLERRAEPVVEAVAVPRMQLRTRNAFRRVLRMEVEGKPLDARAEPTRQPLGPFEADVTERSDVVAPDRDDVLAHPGVLPPASHRKPTASALGSIGLVGRPGRGFGSLYAPGATSFGVSGWKSDARYWMWPRPTPHSDWPPPYIARPCSVQWS
jgi:hypothetical protein